MSFARFLSKIAQLLNSSGQVKASGLESGAAVSNIGYTPVNKAGDTMTGNLKVQVFGNAEVSSQYGTGLEAKIGAYAAETTLYLPSSSVDFRLRARTGASDTLAVMAKYSGVERDGLVVDYLGRVTMPYQPCFYATGLSGQSFTSGSPVVMNLNYAPYSRGSAYNTSTCRFTAPVSGVYMFSISATTSTSGGGAVPALYVNGSPAFGASSYTEIFGYSSAGYNATSARPMVFLSLSAGDYVDVRVQIYNGSSQSIDLTRSSFSGILIG